MIVETVEKTSPGPSSLRDICVGSTGEVVVNVLWRNQLQFQSIYIPEPVERGLREWLEDVPSCLRQDILNRSYKVLFSTIGQVTEMCSSTVPIMLASVVETLYHPSLKHVDVWTDFHWHQEARLKVLHLLHSQESNVVSLNFACYKTPIFQFQALTFSERFLLMNVFNKFKHLKQLKIPYVADDDLLAKLGKGCCPLLEHLDVHGSWEVTNQGVAELSGQDGKMVIGRVGWAPTHFAQCSEGQKLLSSILSGSPVSASQLACLISERRAAEGRKTMSDNLLCIDVSSTAIDWRGLQTVLQNFTNLRRLEADEQLWQNLLVSLGNENQACRDCLPQNLPLKLLNLARNTYTLLEPLSQSFPNIEHLTISNFERSESYLDGVDNLPLLNSFKSLTSLSLQDVEMDQFYNYFEQSGGQKIKSFSYTSRHKTLDLVQMDLLCSSLRELSVSDSVISYKPGKLPPEMHRQIENSSYSDLKYLCLKDVAMEGDQMCWKRLIKKTKYVRRITLQNIRMTDADISDILSVNPLPYLEELNISGSGGINLTEETVFKLIEKCPRLTKIGGVCCWASRDIVALLEQLNSQHHFRIKMDDRD